MSDAKHTPTPWAVEEHFGGAHENQRYFAVVSPDGGYVFTTSWEYHKVEHTNHRRDAHFGALAANCHDELVAALKAIDAGLGCINAKNWHEWADVFHAYTSRAIAKAETKP